MAATLIHFGCDDCHRVAVLKSAGYDIHEPKTLDELGILLLQDQHVAAVIISEEDSRSAEQAATVARERTNVPVILFRRSGTDLNEHLFDRVYASFLQPDEWLAETAELIELNRISCERLKAVGEHSEHLKREVQSAKGQSRWQRARGRIQAGRSKPTALGPSRENESE